MTDVLEARVAKGLSPEARAGLEDLFFFANHFVGLTLEEKPHRKMCDILQEGETNPVKPLSMLVVPRGCYKTSIARAAVVWKFLRQIHLHDNVYHRIVVASATLALGKATMSAIEAIMRYGGKNQRIDEEYGSLWRNRDKDKPGSKLGDALMLGPRIDRGEIATVAEPSLFIGSLRRISTGFHADEALVDDINNVENVRTDHQRKLTHQYWQLLFPILGTHDFVGNPTKVLMICTPWHDDDVRGMILRDEKAREQADPNYVSPWSLYQQGSFYDDGSVFFPSKYPKERLERLREDMGAREYAANYLCDPVGTTGFVEEGLIRFKSRETFPALTKGRICVDPNQHKDAKELGCYAAIVVAGYDKFGRLYVVDAAGSREWDSQRFIEVLFELQARYHNWPIYIEDSHMAHFQHAVRLEETRRSEKEGRLVRLRLIPVPVDVKSTKYERWMRLQPLFRTASVTFADEIPPSIKAEIKEELVRGEVARFKDFLDALALADTGYRPSVKLDGTLAEIKEEKSPMIPRGISFEDAFGKKLRGIM